MMDRYRNRKTGSVPSLPNALIARSTATKKVSIPGDTVTLEQDLVAIAVPAHLA
jgi:hypothetical protein